MTLVNIMRFPTKIGGEAKELCGVDVLEASYVPLQVDEDGHVEGDMPEPREGVVYVCSYAVYTALKDTREDLAMYDPALTVRDEAGRPTQQNGFLFSSF
jgi:hypothetical protein